MTQYLERLNVSSPAFQNLFGNLEILSGMMWNSCGLLLILYAHCMCANNQDRDCLQTPPKNKHACNVVNGIISSIQSIDSNSENDVTKSSIFILGTDGFMAYMNHAGGCWNITNDQSAFWCNSSSSSESNLFNITVFKRNENTTNSSGVFESDIGLSISAHSPYILNISRSIKPVQCLMEGACRNRTWTKWIAEEGCNWALPKNFKVTNCSMTCLDPTKACKKAQYDSSCKDDDAGDESKRNIIKIYNTTATCFKCGSPFEKLEEFKNIPSEMSNLFNNTNQTETNAGAAAAAMKSLTNLVSQMGNLTVASISMGSVKGVLKKIQSVSDVKVAAFIFSSNTGLRVIDDFSELEKYPNAFTIPKEASLQAFNKSAGNAFLGVFRFPNMAKDELNSTVLGGDVYAIEMGTKISNLTENISLAFSNEQQTMATPVCNSWDGTGNKPNWTTEGCTTLINGKKITCNCQHLTFFAVLMIPPNITISQTDLINLTYITYIGCGLSMFFLGVAFFIHFLLRKAKATNSAHVLINLFLALFLLNVTFLSNEYVARANSHSACKVMAGFMHYCLLASFTWFAVEALHLCLQMAKHSLVIKHYILKICVLGWVPPAFVVSIIFVLGKYGEQTIQTESSNVTMCWILDSTVHYVVNIGYYCFVFIFTFSTCIVVLRWLCMLKLSKYNKTGKVKRSGTATLDVTTVLGLCSLLGLTWSFAFFSYGGLRMTSYYIFTILNSFQGFFLFIYYVKTSTLFGDSVPSEDSNNMTEDTNTENPYDNQIPPPAKKDF